MYGGHIRAFLNNCFSLTLTSFTLPFSFHPTSSSSLHVCCHYLRFPQPTPKYLSLSPPCPQSLALSLSLSHCWIRNMFLYHVLESYFSIAIPKWLSIFLSVYFDSKSKLLIETYPEAAKFTHHTYTPYTAHQHSYFGVSMYLGDDSWFVAAVIVVGLTTKLPTLFNTIIITVCLTKIHIYSCSIVYIYCSHKISHLTP